MRELIDLALDGAPARRRRLCRHPAGGAQYRVADRQERGPRRGELGPLGRLRRSGADRRGVGLRRQLAPRAGGGRAGDARRGRHRAGQRPRHSRADRPRRLARRRWRSIARRSPRIRSRSRSTRSCRLLFETDASHGAGSPASACGQQHGGGTRDEDLRVERGRPHRAGACRGRGGDRGHCGRVTARSSAAATRSRPGGQHATGGFEVVRGLAAGGPGRADRRGGGRAARAPRSAHPAR